MKATISIDRAGRFVLPKAFRSRLHLQEGDVLEAEMGGDEVCLRRVMVSPARILREGGRAVWDAPDAAASLEEIEQSIHRGRQERDARASGL